MMKRASGISGGIIFEDRIRISIPTVIRLTVAVGANLDIAVQIVRGETPIRMEVPCQMSHPANIHPKIP